MMPDNKHDQNEMARNRVSWNSDFKGDDGYPPFNIAGKLTDDPYNLEWNYQDELYSFDPPFMQRQENRMQRVLKKVKCVLKKLFKSKPMTQSQYEGSMAMSGAEKCPHCGKYCNIPFSSGQGGAR